MNLKDLKRTVRMANKYYRNVSSDDLLGYVGLQQRRSAMDYALPAIGLLGVGVAVGLGIGFALAPKPGAELRSDMKQDIKQRVNELRERVNTAQAQSPSFGLHSLALLSEERGPVDLTGDWAALRLRPFHTARCGDRAQHDHRSVLVANSNAAAMLRRCALASPIPLSC